MVDFLVIGPINIICYVDIFPLIMSNKINIGYNKVGEFCDGTKFGNINWFTTLFLNDKSYLKLKEYIPDNYIKYDNNDVINVDRTEDIPDYDGIMGVPITFLEKYNKNQFDLVGCPWANVMPDGWNGMSKEFVNLYFTQGNTGQYKEGHIFPCYFKDGKAIIPYARILIKKK